MFTNTNAKQYDRSSMLVYGPTGSGKTKLVTTLPGSPIIINAENGLKTLQGLDIPVYDITVDKDGIPMERHFRFQKLIAFLKMLNNEEHKQQFDWLVIDSLTEISQCYVEFLKLKYPDKKDALVMWGEYNDGLQGFVKQLRDFAPYNILLLCGQAYDKDEMGRRYYGLDINGTKAPQRIPGLFDDCFQLRKFTNDKGEEKRFLITSEYDNNIAKTRSQGLAQFEEANITNILNKSKVD